MIHDRDTSPGTLTRREALKKGTLLGAGALWVVPATRTLQMSRHFAAATSGSGDVPDDPGEKTDPTDPTEPQPPSTEEQPSDNPDGPETRQGPDQPDPQDETDGSDGTSDPDSPDPEVDSDLDQPDPRSDDHSPNPEPPDVLPFTGIDVARIAGLGGGLLAGGTVLVRSARLGVESDGSGDGDRTDQPAD